ncbi:DUF805 domain-containing protein [Nitratireductor aquimarinus]|uniref:DUF805 domain-containing protein n=1 Tax=Nitratireductor aquimarinus TaxID=889300 RepID=A0ABU4ANU8_9HYPH|nr:MULTISPECIES: DUF805 domain-containing protein [Alphaproteobacteria]MBY6020412.1 DUF805 domain-containing protein [Nitratireductor sp. DP7N14-4]MBN7755626.1 DUF805 domain-containing protein [Nitratireductor aquimarinus]MBN7763295.1 DUF805 domain-containing protein [Nitratireductor aquibiodomus]MBN7775992.1 DUF805 domain-containing protein [Nitratireductor pacificus]MBN7780656.1 DUF805 domain-containing protein [Nitratireductor pacificus]
MTKNQISWLFLGFSGRVSRAAFFLAGLLLAVLQALVLYRFTLAPEGSGASGVWALLFWGMFMLSAFSSVALGVKRLHDFGKSGMFAFALFVPMVSILAFIVLCLYPGDPGANEYGERTNAPKQ